MSPDWLTDLVGCPDWLDRIKMVLDLDQWTKKNFLAAPGFRFLPFLAFCLLTGVPQRTAWLYEGHSEIEMKASEPIFQAKKTEHYN